MAGDKHNLPRFPDAARLVWTGATWNKVASLLESWRVRPGRGVAIDVTTSGCIINTTGGGGGGGGSSSTGAFHPFKILVDATASPPSYSIAKGSIQDGTNGAAIDLSGIIETSAAAEAGYVVIEADVDEYLSITGWTKTITANAADTAEVRFTTTGEIRQDKIRLLIGKITLDSEGVPTAWQALYSSVRITSGALGGVAGLVFEHAPTVASAI